MSIKFERVERDGFESDIATLYCDETGKKMLEVIIVESDQNNTIQAKWENSKTQTSGKHNVIGDIYSSPNETATQKTAIIDARKDEKNKTMHHRVLVKAI